MRLTLIAVVALLSSCSAFSQPVSMTSSPKYAELSVRLVHDVPFTGLDGIWTVDNYRFKAHQEHVYVAQGQRSIGYQCQGVLSMDDWAHIQFNFDGGKSYELVCEEKDGQMHVTIQPI